MRVMAFYLCDITSLRPLLCAQAQGKIMLYPTTAPFRPDPPTGSIWANVVPQLLGLGMTLPLHVQVGAAKQLRRSTTCITSRSALDYAPGSFFKVAGIKDAPEIYVATPPRCFLDQAAQGSLLETIRLGYELCGSYLLDTSSERGFRESPGITRTTANSLLQYATNIAACSGVRCARRAGAYVLDNSASPRETDVAMQLFLPPLLGGFGFPKAQLNAPMKRSDGSLICSASAYGQPLRADFYWEKQRVAVEYDSDNFHTGSQRISHDAARRNLLTDGDITVFTLTNNQFKNWNSMRAFCVQLAHALHWYPSASRFNATPSSLALREFLLATPKRS